MGDDFVAESAGPVDSPVAELKRVTALKQVRAEALGERLQGLTAARTQLDHEFLGALAEFDQLRAWTCFDGIGSTAHWLGWACSIAPGTAREQVRVARALVQMPETARLMAAGELTYSKVRELTRLLGVQPEPHEAVADDDGPVLPFDEERLCGIAKEMTASQLARTVRAFRRSAGERLGAAVKRNLAVRTRDDGLVEIRAVLPTEEAALVQAALQTAQSAFETAALEDEKDVPAGTSRRDPERSSAPKLALVDALLDVARGYLAADERDPEDDHHLVTVVVDAETLAGGCSDHGSTCEVQGLAGIEAATATRLSCDCQLIGAIRDSRGQILHWGRTRRTVTKSQRRALRVRDRHCQFPGCTHGRWLKAHHIVHWLHSGPTDLPNLILLCQAHHTAVHEGGITITGGPGGWDFRLPNGGPVVSDPPLSDERLTHALAEWAYAQADRPDPERVFPPGAGEGYSLHECVAALFWMHRAPDAA